MCTRGIKIKSFKPVILNNNMDTYLSIAVTQGVTRAEANAAAARSTAKYCIVQCCCSLILITSVILMRQNQISHLKTFKELQNFTNISLGSGV
jgi:hypothetical protein